MLFYEEQNLVLCFEFSRFGSINPGFRIQDTAKFDASRRSFWNSLRRFSRLGTLSWFSKFENTFENRDMMLLWKKLISFTISFDGYTTCRMWQRVALLLNCICECGNLSSLSQTRLSPASTSHLIPTLHHNCCPYKTSR